MNSVPAIGDWKSLRELFAQMRPTGTDGFEGLMAKIFEAELGQRFYVARAGDQPAGDAYGSISGTVIQTKRYNTTDFSENDVEGEIRRALREVPELDLFVVAATRTASQLKLRLEKIQGETGLDIVLLEMSDNVSALGALAVTQWHVVRSFFPNLDLSADIWARQQGTSELVQTELYRIRLEFAGLLTQNSLSKLASNALAKRFNISASQPSSAGEVFIEAAIPRSGYLETFSNWWAASDSAILTFQGEEGTGKTWIAASCSWQLVRGEGQTVLWLDSIQWGNCRSVEEVIDVALRAVVPPSDQRAQRFLKKILRQPFRPILIVLDGANERKAWVGGEAIVRDYKIHKDNLIGCVRLLFTSRDLTSQGGPQFWPNPIFAVKPFNDEEFALALAKYFPRLNSGELPPRVQDLARIPRYFNLCISLRLRLGTFTHLTKEILLWADLENKVQNGDSQWRELIGYFGGSATDFLAHLAKLVGWPAETPISLETYKLTQNYPDFLKIRADLIEQRVLIRSDISDTIVSPDHITVGWAFAIFSLALAHSNEDETSLVNRIARFLEPAASNDAKARAIHLATLLAFLDGQKTIGNNPNVRAALLALWAHHHNAIVDIEKLQFFLSADFEAYIKSVEMLFGRYMLGHLEKSIIEPLALMWREGVANQDRMQAVIGKWLRLIFPGDASGSKDQNEVPPSIFHTAVSKEQLRLSYAAISIISFRPEISLISALADCYRSVEFCYDDFDKGHTKHRFPIKSPGDPLGILIRWHYGQAGLNEVARLASQHPQNGKEWDSLRWFARQWRIAALPGNLGENADVTSIAPEGSSQMFEELRNYLNGKIPKERRILALDEIGCLAARNDLPELNTLEIDALETDIKERVAKVAKYKTMGGTVEEAEIFNLLPMIARHRPAVFNQLVQQLWKFAIESNEAHGRILSLDEMFPASSNNEPLLDIASQAASRLSKLPQWEFLAINLTELQLIHAQTAEQLFAWLKSIEGLDFKGSPISGFFPLPIAFKHFQKVGFSELVRTEVDAALHRLEKNPDNAEYSRNAKFWLQIFASITDPVNEETAIWALKNAGRFRNDSDLNYPFFSLVSQSPMWATCLSALQNPHFKEFHLGYNSWKWGIKIPQSDFPALKFSDLNHITSLTVSGWLLLRSGQIAELSSWGQALAKAAMESLKAPSGRIPAIDMGVKVDRDKRNAGWDYEGMKGGSETTHNTSSSAWGVDRQSKREMPSDAEYQEELDQFHLAVEDGRTSNRAEFFGFNAVNPLEHWSESDPENFASFAVEYLKGVEQAAPGIFMPLTFFTTAVAIALFRIRPDFAKRHNEQPHQGYHRMVFEGGIPWSTAELWQSRFNGNDTIVSLRQLYLLNAKNDEEVLGHCIAAEIGDNEIALKEIATNFLTSTAESERALAVTLLAFTGCEASVCELQRLRMYDPSYWIREHATWGLDTCIYEIECIRLYRLILEAKTLESAAAIIEQMRPALTPKVRAWRNRVEKQQLVEQMDLRLRGFLKLFWYHWSATSSHKSNVKVCGRRLTDYCRGEKLSSGTTSQMAPWWDI